MNSKKFYILRLILLLSDFIILNASYCSAYFLFVDPPGSSSVRINLLSLAIFNTIWIAFTATNKLYYRQTLSAIENIYRSTWRSVAVHIVVFIIVYYAIHQQRINYRFILFSYSVMIVLMVLNRLLLTYITEFIFKQVVSKRNVLVVGDNTESRQLAIYFKKNKNFYSLEGVFSNHTDKNNMSSPDNKTSLDYVDFAVRHNVTDIYTTYLPHEDEQIQGLKEAAENRGMRLLFVAGNQQHVAPAGYHWVDFIDSMPVLSLRAEPLLRPKNILRKRIYDFVFSSLIIVFILSWLTPLLAILIKLGSKGPVFFKQERSGKDNHTFICYKFRSMTENEHSNTQQATKNDNRITPIGAFMRKKSIDELPQFFNVWTGTMSIVGPRPHMLKHTEEYSTLIDKYLVRHYLKPGITGWAQVNGHRGETTDVSAMEKRVACDIEYLENWSLMKDVKITFMTIINIFRGEENAG